MRLATLEEHVGDKQQAHALFARAANLDAQSPLASYHLGRLAIQEDLIEGKRALFKALQLDGDYLPAVARILRPQLVEADDTEDLATLDDLIDQYNSRQKAARAERDTVSLDDVLSVPVVPDALVPALSGEFEQRPGIKKVYLLEKALTHYPEQPVYLFGVEIDYYSDDIDTNQERWFASLTTTLDGLCGEDATVLTVQLEKPEEQTESETWESRMHSFPDSLIYTGRKTSRAPAFLRGVWDWLKRSLWFFLIVLVALLAIHFSGLADITQWKR